MTLDVDRAAIMAAREELTTSANGPLISVSVGTPHFSFAEFARLAPLMDGRPIAGNIDFYVNTGRDTLARAREAGLVQPLERAGVRIVTDTCTYITPILRRTDGVVMTNSAKWAYYAPGNLGVEVAFGTLEECVRSAQLGRITRDESLWHA
jgi:predicted aconitase